MSRLPFEDRLDKSVSPLLKKLFKIIIDKKTNLCIAANFDTVDEALRFVDQVGQHICILKTQTSHMEGDVYENLKLLHDKKKRYNFLLFEDPKFHDCEKTVAKAYEKKLVQFADLVTLDPAMGPGIFKAIKDVVKKSNLPIDEPRGCLGTCEFSWAGVFPRDVNMYYRACEENVDICSGIIAQNIRIPLERQPDLVKLTPGVHIQQKNDGETNQQWNHPKDVMARGADIIIVGRGITSASESEWPARARQYKEVAWDAYQDQCRK